MDIKIFNKKTKPSIDGRVFYLDNLLNNANDFEDLKKLKTDELTLLKNQINYEVNEFPEPVYTGAKYPFAAFKHIANKYGLNSDGVNNVARNLHYSITAKKEKGDLYFKESFKQYVTGAVVAAYLQNGSLPKNH